MVCDKNPENVRNLFNEIAQYYDKTNNFISVFSHYIIKYFALRELNIKPRSLILDVCCGTGDFTRLIAKVSPRSRVIGVDFCENMLKIAKNKNPKGVFVLVDCLELPFKEREFNYVTAGFGLRNIKDRAKAVSEIYRVLDFDGQFLHLDFGIRNSFSKVFDRLVPVVAKCLKINLEHYKYLINSKQEFPEPDELIKEFETHGFKLVKRVDYLFGVISAQIMQK